MIIDALINMSDKCVEVSHSSLIIQLNLYVLSSKCYYCNEVILQFRPIDKKKKDSCATFLKNR